MISSGNLFKLQNGRLRISARGEFTPSASGAVRGRSYLVSQVSSRHNISVDPLDSAEASSTFVHLDESQEPNVNPVELCDPVSSTATVLPSSPLTART